MRRSYVCPLTLTSEPFSETFQSFDSLTLRLENGFEYSVPKMTQDTGVDIATMLPQSSAERCRLLIKWGGGTHP